MADLDPDRRKIVLDVLKSDPLPERDLIDVLLMVLDDWEIRNEIVRNQQRGATNAQTNQKPCPRCDRKAVPERAISQGNDQAS